MDRKGKGKQVAGNESSFGGQKRKSSVEFRDEGLRIKKRKNPEVLQFFEESAEVGYYGGSSDEDDDGFGFLNVLLRCVTRYRIKSSEFSMAQERKSRRLSEEVVGNSSGAKLSRSEHSMATSSEPNKSSYDFTVKDAKGNDVDLSIYKGKSSLDCERCFSVWLDQFELY